MIISIAEMPWGLAVVWWPCFLVNFVTFFLNCGLLISLGLLCAERICVTCLGHLRKNYHFRIIFDTFPAGDSLSIHFTRVRLQTQVISTSFQETQHWEKQYIPLQKKETNTPVILYCKCSPFGARFVGEKGKRPPLGFPSSIGTKIYLTSKCMRL